MLMSTSRLEQRSKKVWQMEMHWWEIWSVGVALETDIGNHDTHRILHKQETTDVRKHGHKSQEYQKSNN